MTTVAATIDTAYFHAVDPFDGQPDDPARGDQAVTKIWVEPSGLDGTGLDVSLAIDRTNIRLDMSAKEARDLATLLIAALRR